MVIATKCGIRFAGQPAAAPYRYDSSAAHIIASCEQSLQRMGVETIDLYQIHRPDWLMDAAEMARALEQLVRQGKVRAFGVSNFLPAQVELLQQACAEPLAVNQIEVSLMQLDAFENGVLDQCQARRMTPLAWSPLGGGMLGEGAVNVLPSQRDYRPAAVVAELDRIRPGHGASRTATALAWLLKHPAGIVPIIGSTQPERIRAAAAATGVELSREEWYRLLEAARGERLP
jgi:predicted oxidoreductase